ncbi:hypothetical protein HS088_TW04G00194 [Tripterygium wilfordii]|uniref:Uncharacterized protein n=1 Tax=Tripterygium wilfordii TaxID=458696 RepID=A0A7J7DPD3_TRIWF|nr:hypothetical protein HS088_TW04G00194 [Tripterygium wilfordii]
MQFRVNYPSLNILPSRRNFKNEENKGVTQLLIQGGRAWHMLVFTVLLVILELLGFSIALLFDNCTSWDIPKSREIDKTRRTLLENMFHTMEYDASVLMASVMALALPTLIMKNSSAHLSQV